MKRFGFAIVCSALAILAFSQPSLAQTEMTYEEYKLKLADNEKRTAQAKRGLAECTTASDELSKQIEELDGQIAGLQGEIYELVGSDETGVSEFIQENDRYESRLVGLMRLSDDGLFEARDELDRITARLEELKADKRALLPDAQKKIESMERLLEQIQSRMPRKRVRQYSVIRGDNLWKIANKEEIYNDPYMWPRIYVENKSLIKNPDLIYPSWVLNVPFGVDLNQHLVMRGENLSLIAGKVFKDITRWNRIYQANKSQILDPNLIFPAQVIEIPAN